MPSKKRSNPKAYLFHIRDNITLARGFVDGFEYERFRDDPLVFYAVTRALGIISEASRRLPVALKERHPEIPWTDGSRSWKRLPARLRGRAAAPRLGHRAKAPSAPAGRRGA
jgi:uncharacterized protein with HEPN domain